MSVSVCLCVSVRDRIFETKLTRPIFTIFCVHVFYGCGSVLLWRRSDTLCNRNNCGTRTTYRVYV